MKPSVQGRTVVAKRSQADFTELEIVDWDTRIDFPPSQETRTIRVRFVEIPERPLVAGLDPRD